MLLSIRGVELYVCIRGNGSPIILVHGFPLDHSMWSYQIEFLSKRHRVIAPDLRCFGRSEVTPGMVSMQQFAEDLAELLNVLQITEPVAFMGLSMGGYIAWPFIQQSAKRVGRLILCDTRSLADTEEMMRGRMMMAARVMDEGIEFVPDVMLPKIFAPKSFDDYPERIATMRKVILNNSRVGIAAAQRGMAGRPDSTDLMAQIDIPTLVIVGQHDPISPPAEMRRMAELIPHANFREIRDAGHMAPLENPAEVNCVLEEFLE